MYKSLSMHWHAYFPNLSENWSVGNICGSFLKRNIVYAVYQARLPLCALRNHPWMDFFRVEVNTRTAYFFKLLQFLKSDLVGQENPLGLVKWETVLNSSRPTILCRRNRIEGSVRGTLICLKKDPVLSLSTSRNFRSPSHTFTKSATVPSFLPILQLLTSFSWGSLFTFEI